jgi:hypothetical protein
MHERTCLVTPGRLDPGILGRTNGVLAEQPAARRAQHLRVVPGGS